MVSKECLLLVTFSFWWAVSFSTFLLKEKVEQKVQGKSNAPQLFPGPRTTVFSYRRLDARSLRSFFLVLASLRMVREYKLLTTEGCGRLQALYSATQAFKSERL